jgi:hypothetical protein
VPGDHGAHGAFGDRATDRSLQLWATTHRRWLGAAGAAAAALLYTATRRKLSAAR